MSPISKSEYDVFLAYYQKTGIDFATYLKRGLGEQGFTAFLDIEDISKLIRPKTSKWSDERDRALENSKRFVLLMTKGFNTRREVVHELKLAMKLKKDRLHFKHEYLVNSDLIVKINHKSIDLSDNEYIEFISQQDLLRKILNVLSIHKKAPKLASLKPSEQIPKLEITDLKMKIVDGDLRVNFELWNNGKLVVKVSGIHGIAIDKKGKEIPPRAREPGDLIPIGKRKTISMNFKHYNENYKEIAIIKKYNGQTEEEDFKVKYYLKNNT